MIIATSSALKESVKTLKRAVSLAIIIESYQKVPIECLFYPPMVASYKIFVTWTEYNARLFKFEFGFFATGFLVFLFSCLNCRLAH